MGGREIPKQDTDIPVLVCFRRVLYYSIKPWGGGCQKIIDYAIQKSIYKFNFDLEVQIITESIG